jgi:hypothetical protein
MRIVRNLSAVVFGFDRIQETSMQIDVDVEGHEIRRGHGNARTRTRARARARAMYEVRVTHQQAPYVCSCVCLADRITTTASLESSFKHICINRGLRQIYMSIIVLLAFPLLNTDRTYHQSALIL